MALETNTCIALKNSLAQPGEAHTLVRLSRSDPFNYYTYKREQACWKRFVRIGQLEMRG